MLSGTLTFFVDIFNTNIVFLAPSDGVKATHQYISKQS